MKHMLRTNAKPQAVTGEPFRAGSAKENAGKGNITQVDGVASIRNTCHGPFEGLPGPWTSTQSRPRPRRRDTARNFMRNRRVPRWGAAVLSKHLGDASRALQQDVLLVLLD